MFLTYPPHPQHWLYPPHLLSWIQYFPGRPMVMNLLQSLNSWLRAQSGNEISYEALKKILDNTAQVSPERVWTFLKISVPDWYLQFFLSAFLETCLSFKAAVRKWGVEAALVCVGSTHKPAKVNWPWGAQSKVSGLFGHTGRQVKATSETPTLTEIRHCIPDDTKGLQKHLWFKTAVCEAQRVCCCFGARPACLQCTTLLNWNTHLDTSLAFSAEINGSINRWEGMKRLRLWGNGLARAHTHSHTHALSHTPKVFTIDMWVSLSIRPATAAGCGERNDFVSEKICCWI